MATAAYLEKIMNRYKSTEKPSNLGKTRQTVQNNMTNALSTSTSSISLYNLHSLHSSSTTAFSERQTFDNRKTQTYYRRFQLTQFEDLQSENEKNSKKSLKSSSSSSSKSSHFHNKNFPNFKYTKPKNTRTSAVNMGNCSSKEPDDEYSTNKDFKFKEFEALQKEVRESRAKINKLENQLKEKEEIAQNLENKDKEISELKNEIKRISTVGTLKSTHINLSPLKPAETNQTKQFQAPPRLKGETTTSIENAHKEAFTPRHPIGASGSKIDSDDIDYKKNGQLKAVERLAVSAQTENLVKAADIPVHFKSNQTNEFLINALTKLPFFSGLTQKQLLTLVDSMDRQNFERDTELIKEGDEGDVLYVIETGSAIVTTEALGRVAMKNAGEIFGELALMYHCKRNATVTTYTRSVIYRLHQKYFKVILQTYGSEQDSERFNFIRKMDKLSHLSVKNIKKLVQILEEDTFDHGERIITQGAIGDQFYIIKEGTVRCTINQADGTEKEVAVLEKGQYFGEKALQSSDRRAANVYAKSKSVTTLSLNRQAFTSLIGTIDEHGSDTEHRDSLISSNSSNNNNKIYGTDDTSLKASKQRLKAENILLHGLENAKMEDCHVIKSLGSGGFGAVKLVFFKNNQVEKRLYALKCVGKHRIVKYKQQRHIQDEKNILLQIKNNFVMKCYRTFKDERCVYILSDAYLGGDLWRLLHARGPFPDTVGRFYAACVIEGFDYLHQRDIVYRDLKPENLMLDKNGYLRIVDLGFAKKVPIGSKTWTFCGTPEYIPPEIINNSGHGIPADYWCLGILIYELCSRKTPFKAKDDLAIYSNVLKGIDSCMFSYKISKKCEQLIKALCRLVSVHFFLFFFASKKR